MSLGSIKALTVDTGGTVLDWHSGFKAAFAKVGQAHNIERDWGQMANDLRRRTMQMMLNLGENEPPEYNFDDAHRKSLDAVLTEADLHQITEAQRLEIAYEAPHRFDAWPDVKPGLTRLRALYPTVSFTLLSYRIIIDTARQNGLTWDAVFSCEGMGVYKLLPEAYRKAAAFLQLDPAECLMVACHPFDLDAAKAVGFCTALVRRPDEWGPNPDDRPTLPPADTYDIEVDGFEDLANALERGIQ